MAARELRAAAVRVEAERHRALLQSDAATFAALDRQLMRAERALLDPDGLPGRRRYRHVVFAPKFTHAPETLPAVAEAVQDADRQDADRARVRAASGRLAAALRLAAATLGEKVR